MGVVVTSTALDLIPAAGGCHTEKSVLFCHPLHEIQCDIQRAESDTEKKLDAALNFLNVTPRFLNVTLRAQKFFS